MKSAPTNDAAIDQLSIFPKTKEQLPDDFQPYPYTVIIGKGRLPANAIGNRRLRVLVECQLKSYANAKHKRDKTLIVSNLLYAFQEACPEGAFVKYDGETWWQVSDSTAREKIAATFRDCLHGMYKSSTKNKVAKRRALKAIKRSNSGVSSSTQTSSSSSSCDSSEITEDEDEKINANCQVINDDSDTVPNACTSDEVVVLTTPPPPRKRIKFLRPENLSMRNKDDAPIASSLEHWKQEHRSQPRRVSYEIPQQPEVVLSL